MKHDLSELVLNSYLKDEGSGEELLKELFLCYINLTNYAYSENPSIKDFSLQLLRTAETLII
jgi:hypothetical protein